MRLLLYADRNRFWKVEYGFANDGDILLVTGILEVTDGKCIAGVRSFAVSKK